MPDFNTFRTNEELLGKVIVARQQFDLVADEDEHMEARKFLYELEEKKINKKSNLYLRFVGLLTGKKYIQFRDRFGQKITREDNSQKELKPELRISITVDRQIDFGDDVNEWRKYVHEENVRSEKNRIERKEKIKNRKLLLEAYSQIINNVMMKLN